MSPSVKFRNNALCGIMGMVLQRIHLFVSHGVNGVLHRPYTDTFLIPAHDVFQSRFSERVVHLEATRATAEFPA